MNTKEEQPILFHLQRIVTEQFAIIPEYLKDSGEVKINVAFRFGSIKSQKMIAVLAKCTFEMEEKAFIILECNCQFKIEENWWEQHSNTDGSITFPRAFIIYIGTIAVGTLRGVLHSKTENTPYNNFVLTAVNVDSILTEDVTFN